MDKIEKLLEGLNEWRNRTGKFLNKLPVIEQEQHRYLPTFYRTEAWYLEQLANQWELENDEGVFTVETPKKELLKAEKI